LPRRVIPIVPLLKRDFQITDFHLLVATTHSEEVVTAVWGVMFGVGPGDGGYNFTKASPSRDQGWTDYRAPASCKTNVLYTSLPQSRAAPAFTGFSRILRPSIVLVLYM
jgi:hypothetical protein